jgi:hypothetical protein
MLASVSVFLEFNLPNATTWFYFSFLLAIAIFFKFSRLLSVRNLDVVTLFLLAPGLMLIQSSRPSARPLAENAAVETASFVAGCASPIAALTSSVGGVEFYERQRRETADAARTVWVGYLWILCGSVYLFCRCLVDLVLVQRPALTPNLTFGGLAWLALALVVCLTAVVFREPDRPRPAPGTSAPELPTPPPKTVPETAFAAIARQWFEPTSVMMRGFAMVGHLAVVLGLMMLGRLHFQDALAGMAAATLYLMLPYTGMYVRYAGHVWPMAIIVWMVVAYRLPSLAGVLLGLATSTYYPILLFPVFLSFYWRRGAGRFAFCFLVTAAIVLGTVAFALHLRGSLEASIREGLSLTSWQPWKVPPPDMEGFWTGVHSAYRIPVFIAYVAFVLATAVWPMPKTLAHLLALATAVMIGTQLWYGDQGGTYVLWYLPLLLLVMFRPNLETARPAVLTVENDWLTRLRFSIRRQSRVPEPTPTS